MMPTADQVAWAIVAACRETGDDPIKVAVGEPGLRARHYAMHALGHVFQDLGRVVAARLVGADKPQFWTSSWNQVVKTRASGSGHMANWFDDGAYGRVIAILEEHTSKPAPEPADEAKPTPAPKPPSIGLKAPLRAPAAPAPVSIGPDLEPETVLDKFVSRAGPKPHEAGGDDQLTRRALERRSLQQILAEAAANTAKLPIGEEGE